jgi:hypothetical protein
MNLYESIKENINSFKTIQSIESELTNLDSEYREALAQALIDLDIITETPLQMEQNGKLDIYEKIINKPLTRNQASKIISTIAKTMQNDFQFQEFNNIFGSYINENIGDVSFDNIKYQEKQPKQRTSIRKPVIDKLNSELNKYGCQAFDVTSPLGVGISTTFCKQGTSRGIRTSLGTKRVNPDEFAMSFNRTTANKFSQIDSLLDNYKVSTYSTPSDSGDYIFGVYKRADIPGIAKIIGACLNEEV